jgi:outer membrane protein OmpA-like peptidoglycan-associated protein
LAQQGKPLASNTKAFFKVEGHTDERGRKGHDDASWAKKRLADLDYPSK